jgi:hypothetical protein
MKIKLMGREFVGVATIGEKLKEQENHRNGRNGI